VTSASWRASDEDVAHIAAATHHNPFSILGLHFGELRMHSTFEISKAMIRFNDLHDPSGAEAKFIEREIDLAAVRRVRVDEGWLARLFGYGPIEIFTDRSPEPAAVIPGVTRPHSFKEKFKLAGDARPHV